MRRPANIGASVRARLLNLSRARNQPFQLLLTRFVLERLLYRLSLTAHADRFVLKGVMLMTTWFEDPFRPTRDLDLLGTGNPDAEGMLAIFRAVCGVAADDGVVLDGAALSIETIREDLTYGGLRLKTNATVGGARIRVVVDIGFGDAVEPEEREIPVLLDLPAPRLRAYRPETVIAEKFQAIVVLGRANTRMKDFYDIWLLARSMTFEGDTLARAIRATFDRRSTAIPSERPDGLTKAFAADAAKRQQWQSFVADVAAGGPLDEVIEDLAQFLMTHAHIARSMADR